MNPFLADHDYLAPHDYFPPPMLQLRAAIFKAAMSCKWTEVLDLFRENRQVRYEKITRNNDTVLHVTISGAMQNIVSQLLKTVRETNTRAEISAILGAKNKRGETPLHMAAALGQEHVCYLIANMMPEMVTEARNDDQETPLFTAVRHGRKHAFFVLEDAIWKSNKRNKREINRHPSTRDISHCRRYDGNNILHYAIKGEHFGLAYEIIHLYPELVNYVNASRESALHVLANMPSVFKSGTCFSFYDRIIYYCIITEPLELKFHNFLTTEKYLSPDIHRDESEVMPKTYKVCVDLFKLFKERVLKFNCIDIGSRLREGICTEKNSGDDLEQPGSEKGVHAHEAPESQEQRRIPQNYDVAASFLKIIFKLLLVVLRIGLRRLQSIRKLKQKHRNAKTIMKEMVDQSKLWEYEDADGGGMKPEYSTLQKLYDTEYPPDLTTTEVTVPGPEENQQNPSKAHGSEIMIAAREGGKDALKKVLEKFSLEAKNLDKKDIIFMGIDEKKSMNEPNVVRASASPVLVAAKRGITEMVTRILEKFPVAILDQDEDEKNIVLLAVEHRQVHVYKYMLNVPTMKEDILGKVDKEGNSALHPAAMLTQSRSLSMHGAALQMQYGSNWFKYVLDSVDQGTFAEINNKGETAQDVFLESHQTLMKEGSSWLTNTAQSCTVVAALIATVAFATASQVPGGVNQDHGSPVLADKLAFQMFAISSLVALCFSVTSLVLFLAILTSCYQASQFESGLPMKLLLGLTTLFISIASMLVSFCAGDFFVVGVKLKFVAYPIYAVMCFPVMFFPLDF